MQSPDVALSLGDKAGNLGRSGQPEFIGKVIGEEAVTQRENIRNL